LAATAAALTGPAAAGACLTPVAADGHEPPCSPGVGSQVWAVPHRGPYAQDSSPFPAPGAGDAVRVDKRSFPNEVPVIIQVSEPYADGKRVLWFSTVGVPEARGVYKLDYDTLEVLGHYDAYEEGSQPDRLPTTSGVYNALLPGGRFVTVRGDRLELYGEQRPGVRTSDLVLLKRLPLPAQAKCGTGDRVIGLTVLYSGEIAFATVNGVVGVVPPDRFDAGHVAVHALNTPAQCAAGGDAIEGISNSVAADEDGGIYPVSTKAMYRIDWRDGRLTRRWRTPYKAGGASGGARQDAGSGSTPSIMGTHPGDDRFVVITDGQKLMHLDLFRLDDGRLECEYPVRFGDPNATASNDEQSVLVRGYASVVVNNALGLDQAFALFPSEIRPLATLTTPAPGNAPKGMERVDWNPRTRTCHTVWANRGVSVPNGVPTMSAASGLVYGQGLRDQTWGLEGLDFVTGASRLWVPAGADYSDNSFFAQTTVAGDGNVVQGAATALIVYRGPHKPEPPRECRDLESPSLTAVHARAPGRRLVVRGAATDRACGRPGAVRAVVVEVRRRGRLVAVRRTRGARWRVVMRLARGRYAIGIRATDAAGNVTRLRSRVRRAPAPTSR
jgi:hypothetical protein